MPPTRARLVRRTPFISRLKAYLNPWDFLLWASEELNGNDWDDFYRQWATPIGILFNVVFMAARANSSGTKRGRGDDVFGDFHERSGSGWLIWFASFVVQLLSMLSVMNAVYTFSRKRYYRLFESSVDVSPSTPSARRVRVDSSPLSSSPLRFLSNMISASSSEARAHPDETRDVWELAVWDPTPLCLRLFCLFSPGHILVYWLFLPLAPLDPRPSVTVVTTVVLATLLSTQLLFLQTSFSQQSKDATLIQKEVLNEYDTKFVHPSLNKEVRDVGTQMLSSVDSTVDAEVNTYRPVTFVNRGFRTNPNPNYAPKYDPDGVTQFRVHSQRLSHSVTTPNFHTPNMNGATDFSSPIRPAATTAIRNSHFRDPPQGGDGGNLGIYNHAYSPLKKVGTRESLSGYNGVRERSPLKQEGSALKRSSTPGGGFPANGGIALNQRFSQLRGDGVRWESGRY